jgi:hypothetical protein
MKACEKGFPLLIEYCSTFDSFDVNQKNKSGETLLYKASAFGNSEIVSFLCSLDDVDVNILTISNETPLYIAVVNHQTPIVDILLSKKSKELNINCKCGYQSLTPMSFATQNNMNDIVLKLHEAGAQTDIPDIANLTAVQYANMWSNTEAYNIFTQK